MTISLPGKRAWFVPLFALVFAGCGEKETEAPDSAGTATPVPAPIQTATMAAAEYQDPDAEFPRLAFADGTVSENDRCPVRKAKLNRRMPPLYVNGRPIGFC